MRSSTEPATHLETAGKYRGCLVATAIILCAFGVTPFVVRGSGNARLAVFVSGDSRGYLEPCGCRTDQAGGLPVRASLIGEEHGARLVVDVGNFAAGSRPYELLKTRTMLEGMRIIGYDAVNLGSREAALDSNTLKAVLAADLPYVSANVTPAVGTAFAPAYRIIKRGGLVVGVTGVAELAATSLGRGVAVRSPIESLAEVIPLLRRKCDMVVVLAWTRPETMERIALTYSEVDCVLGGNVPETSASVAPVNRAGVFGVVDKGKTIGRLRVWRDAAGELVCTGEARRVRADGPVDPRMVELLGRYRSELRSGRYSSSEREGLQPLGRSDTTRYAGARSCEDCHPREFRIWSDSAHRMAFDCLKPRGYEHDPECLSCHTVGYSQPGGFANEQATPELTGVQCESCHSGASAHAASREKRRLTPVTAGTCARCHDEENSASFDFKRYWRKVAH